MLTVSNGTRNLKFYSNGMDLMEVSAHAIYLLNKIGLFTSLVTLLKVVSQFEVL